ncbi:hypothetical protein DY000_02046447 [Brassica cretica]|uniref:Uncharacterized protein n=1 Tax=Brassica cretica TaxID=69181 RepID=A0ABQ7EQF9_BRACR|nr:hypothetical protein DY000_02046447 [Brassica cretica]
MNSMKEESTEQLLCVLMNPPPPFDVTLAVPPPPPHHVSILSHMICTPPSSFTEFVTINSDLAGDVPAAASSSSGTTITRCSLYHRLNLQSHQSLRTHQCKKFLQSPEKSVEIMRKFSEKNTRRSWTYFCVDKGVIYVVIKFDSLWNDLTTLTETGSDTEAHTVISVMFLPSMAPKEQLAGDISNEVPIVDESELSLNKSDS